MKLLIYIILPLILFLQSGYAEQEALEYKNLEHLKLNFKINVIDKKWLVIVEHLKLKNLEQYEKIIPTKNGLVYHFKSGSTFYAEGYSRSEFLTLLKNQNPKFDFYYVFNIVISPAFSDESKCPKIPPIQALPEFAQVDSAFEKLNLYSMIKKCDFTISNIFEVQLSSLSDLGTSFLSGDLWENISKAVSNVTKLLPMIKEKLAPSLSLLMTQSPAIAEKLFCNFTEKKIGAAVMATFTGGLTTAPLIASTVNDITKLVEKINILSNNKKLLRLIKELADRKLLTKEIIESITKLTRDIPASLKNPQTNRFRAADNRKTHHEKHGETLGTKTELEYEEKAKKFAGSESTADTVSFTEKNGDFIKWDTKSDEMVVLNKYGNFITYFKLNCKNEIEKLLYVIVPKEKKKEICKN